MAALRLFRVGTWEVTRFELRGKCEFCGSPIKHSCHSMDEAHLLIGSTVCNECLAAGRIPSPIIQPLFPKIYLEIKDDKD